MRLHSLIQRQSIVVRSGRGEWSMRWIETHGSISIADFFFWAEASLHLPMVCVHRFSHIRNLQCNTGYKRLNWEVLLRKRRLDGLSLHCEGEWSDRIKSSRLGWESNLSRWRSSTTHYTTATAPQAICPTSRKAMTKSKMVPLPSKTYLAVRNRRLNCVLYIYPRERWRARVSMLYAEWCTLVCKQTRPHSTASMRFAPRDMQRGANVLRRRLTKRKEEDGLLWESNPRRWRCTSLHWRLHHSYDDLYHSFASREIEKEVGNTAALDEI